MLRTASIYLSVFGFVFYLSAGPCFSQTAASLDDSKANVISLIKSGSMAEAGSAVDKLIADFPAGGPKGQAIQQIAAVYKDNKAYDKAIELSRYVIANWPDEEFSIWCQMQVVWSYAMMGDIPAAEAQTEKLIADYGNDPNLPWTVCIIAELHQWYNRYDEATSLYEWVVEHYPGSSWEGKAKLGLARVNVLRLIDSGRISRADKAVDKLISDFASDSELPQSLRAIADRYKWSEMYEEAEKLYELSALGASESDSALRAQVDLGAEKSKIMSLVEAGRDAEASEAMDRLIADLGGDANLPETIYWFARRYEWSNNFERAKSIYEQLIGQYPDSAYAKLSQRDIAKSKILAFLGVLQRREPLRRVDIIGRDFPDDSYLVQAAGRLPEQQGQSSPGSAVVVWEQAIGALANDSPFAAWAWDVAADIRLRSGDFERALANYQKIIAEWPDYEFACKVQFSMVKCYEALRDSGGMAQSQSNEKIEQRYAAIVDGYPDCPSVGRAFLELGWLSFKRGQWASAAGFFESALDKYPDDERPLYILYPLGRAYEQTGRLDKAAQMYGGFMNALSADDPRIETVKARIENLPVVGK